MRHNGAQVEMPLAFRQTDKDRALGRVGPENLVEDGLKKKCAKGVKHADGGQHKHARQPLQRVGQAIAQQAQKIPHAARPASGAKAAVGTSGAGRENIILVLYPAGVPDGPVLAIGMGRGSAFSRCG